MTRIGAEPGCQRFHPIGAYAARVTANRPLRRSVKVNRARIPWKVSARAGSCWATMLPIP